MKIQITQQDIEDGLPGDCHGCPVALAISRALPDIHEVSVCDRRVLMDGKSIRFPDEVTQFIDRFDFFKTVTPFEFELDWTPT